MCWYLNDRMEKLLNFKILKFFYKEEFQNSSCYFNFEIVNHHTSYSQSVQELVSYLLSFHTVLNNYHVHIYEYAGKKLGTKIYGSSISDYINKQARKVGK